MTPKDFHTLVNTMHIDEMNILKAKGVAYSGTTSVFNNFVTTAERSGLSKYQVWLVLFSKHIDCITNAIKAAPMAPVDYTEGLDGRIKDARAYLALLQGMLTEDNKATNNPNVLP